MGPRGKLCDDLHDRVAVIDVQTFAAGNFEAAGIEAELMQYSSVNVRDIMSAFDGMETKFIGPSVNESALDSPAGHPDRKPVRMVLAPRGWSIYTCLPA